METLNAELCINGFYAYEVEIHDHEYVHEYLVIAKGSGGAIYQAFIKSGLSEYISYQEFMFSDFKTKTRKIDNAKLKHLFMCDDTLDYCRKYRNMPFLKLGMKIEVCDKKIAYVIGGSNIIEFYIPENNRFGRDHPGSIKFLQI